MAKRAKLILALGIFLLLVTTGILQWSWHRVDGSEIAFLNVIPDDCTAEVKVQTWDQQGWQEALDAIFPAP